MRIDWNGVIRQYKDYLPVSSRTPVISLDEGNTPLVFAEFLSKKLGNSLKVYLKYEGLNPTGSFKDRGMTVAISKALEEGARAVICASTGNTSASASSYAAKAGLKCFVIIPEGAIALGKLAQGLVHGARVIAIKGNFDSALDIVKRLSVTLNITLVNSLNPFRLQGQKTAAFEICDVLKRAPDYNVIPVGNAGNITAYWMGYKEYYANKKIKSLPKMVGLQASGAAPIVKGKPIKNPKTIASAIRIGNPASWQRALQARDESGGLITTVSDKQILDAYRLLADREGLFVEPASAASVAGLIKLSREGYFKKGATIVCILTGHGLKDPDRAISSAPKIKVVAADFKKVKELIL